MAVEMIGGPRLCEPLLATGHGRFTGAAPDISSRDELPGQLLAPGQVRRQGPGP